MTLLVYKKTNTFPLIMRVNKDNVDGIIEYCRKNKWRYELI